MIIFPYFFLVFFFLVRFVNGSVKGGNLIYCAYGMRMKPRRTVTISCRVCHRELNNSSLHARPFFNNLLFF